MFLSWNACVPARNARRNVDARHIEAAIDTLATETLPVDIAVVLASYGLGCLCTGYYLVRLVRGIDVRDTGSGVTGAMNVGRVLGPPGFLVTLVLDGAKGVLAVWGASQAGVGALGRTLALLAVMSGHIWPAQLGFRGGKGVATALGGLALYEPRTLLAIAGVFLLFLPVVRAFVPTGLLAFLFAPLALFPLGLSAVRLTGLLSVAALILVAHRRDLPRFVRGIPPSRAPGGGR